MILEEFDSAKTAVINPDVVAQKIKNFPSVTVSCFSQKLFENVLEFLDYRIIAYIHSANGRQPIYEVNYKGENFAFYMSYVGGPKCVGDYEELLAMGSKCLILTGSCGVLDKNIDDCAIIIPNKAIRDEGCSYHYASPSDTIDINHKYKDLFKEILEEENCPYIEGTTWTTDAFFRETYEKTQRRREQGAICVEMECASMQALCDFRETDFFQFLYASDNLDGPAWDKRSLSSYEKLDDKTALVFLAFDLGLKIKEEQERDN
jgi:uridine phosphorylase